MQLQNKIISIYGLMGTGKSFLAMFLASHYVDQEKGPRIYSNFDLYRNGKLMSTKIFDMESLNSIQFDEQKGIAILDESGINISARKSMTASNLNFLEMGMLSRKKNIDIIVISQLERSLDVVMRELCTYSFTMENFYDRYHKMQFRALIKGRFDFIIGEKEFDLIHFSQQTGWTYNTKENSKIDRTIKAKVKPTKDEKKIIDKVLKKAENREEKKVLKKEFNALLNFAHT